MCHPLTLRQILLEEGGLPWPEVQALAWETEGVYTLRREDELHLLLEGRLLARLGLGGDLLYLAEEEAWEPSTPII